MCRTRPSPTPWRASNVFRGRPTVDARSFDLTVAVTDVCVADCVAGPMAIAVQVSNQGADDVPSGVPLTLYAEESTGPRVVATLLLGAVPAGTALAGTEIALAPGDVGELGLRVVVDDDGTGRGVLAECDEANNATIEQGVGCPP